MAKVREEIGDGKNTKNVIVYCCKKYSGAKLKDIGERFGMSDAAVSQTCRRLLLKAKKDQQFNKTIHRLEAMFIAVRS
jgi:chromosomal replication initiation ATPase DnaA